MSAYRQNYTPPRRGIRWMGVFFTFREVLAAIGQAVALGLTCVVLYFLALVATAL